MRSLVLGETSAGSDLWRSPSPRTDLDQVGCLLQSSFACLQGWRFPSISVHLHISIGNPFFPLNVIGISHTPACVCCISSYSCAPLSRAWLHLLLWQGPECPESHNKMQCKSHCLDLLAAPLLMQPSMQEAFLAAQIYCWVLFNLVSTRTSASFSTELLFCRAAFQLTGTTVLHGGILWRISQRRSLQII